MNLALSCSSSWKSSVASTIITLGLIHKMPSQAAPAYGSGATHGPTAHDCAPAAITPAAKMLSAALTSLAATKPQHLQRSVSALPGWFRAPIAGDQTAPNCLMPIGTTVKNRAPALSLGLQFLRTRHPQRILSRPCLPPRPAVARKPVLSHRQHRDRWLVRTCRTLRSLGD